MKTICCLLLTVFLNLQAHGKEEAWKVSAEVLSPNIEQYDCHSPSIVEVGQGKLCVAWKGGLGTGLCNVNGKENLGIWFSLFNGAVWSEPQKMTGVSNGVCGTPVLCAHPSGELLLFYRVGPNPRQVVSVMKRSYDGGVSWSDEEILPAGIIGPTKNKPIVTTDGTIISPSSSEVGQPGDVLKATACWIEISADKGIHWQKIGPIALPHRKFGVIEPALFFDQQGHLKMVCRDRAHRLGGTGYIWEAFSQDGGYHWSEFKQTELPNPDSGIDLVDLGKGRAILFYNHSHTSRFPLNFAISLDGGVQWSEPFILDEVGEFPAAILTTDGLIHVTYAAPSSESGQRKIKHVVMNLRAPVN